MSVTNEHHLKKVSSECFRPVARKIAGLFFASTVLFATMLTVSVDNGARAAEDASEDDADEVRTLSSDAPDSPRRHFRMQEVAELPAAEANRLYDIVKGSLAKGYAFSGFEGADTYQSLERYNSAPYLSATHGNHYVNNYANGIASKYGNFEKAGQLPVGSIIYKDSFSVAETQQEFSFTHSRQIVLGPLFIMRKMEPGFNRVTGDWQYIQIQPDGTLFGMTGGEGADRVEYCIGCHLAREEFDHLYFIPDSYRSN